MNACLRAHSIRDDVGGFRYDGARNSSFHTPQYIPFPLSPRFSPAVIAHLLKKSGASYILVNDDPKLQELIQEAVKLLGKGTVVAIHKMPYFEDIFLQNSMFEYLPSINLEPSDTAMLVHSSSLYSDS